jgi:hypothetical protein
VTAQVSCGSGNGRASWNKRDLKLAWWAPGVRACMGLCRCLSAYIKLDLTLLGGQGWRWHGL